MVKKSKGQKKARRWFAEASGWGLNLALGSADSKNKTRRSFSTGSDDQISDNQVVVTSPNFLENTLYTANALAPITQGTTQGSRIGNAILVKAIHGTFKFDTVTASGVVNGCNIRLLLVELTQQYSITNFTSGVGSSDMFFGSSVGLTIARIDPRLCNVICDEVLHIMPRVLGTPDNITTNLGCVINKRFEYRAATVFGTASNFYWVVVGNLAGGTTGVSFLPAMHADLVVDYKII